MGWSSGVLQPFAVRERAERYIRIATQRAHLLHCRMCLAAWREDTDSQYSQPTPATALTRAHSRWPHRQH